MTSRNCLLHEDTVGIRLLSWHTVAKIFPHAKNSAVSFTFIDTADFGENHANSTMSLTPWSYFYTVFLSQPLKSFNIKLCSIIDTEESDSTGSLTVLNQTLRYHWHRGVRLQRVLDSTESSFAVSLTPRSQTQQGPWQYWIKLCGAVGSQSCFLSWPLVAFKGIVN